MSDPLIFHNYVALKREFEAILADTVKSVDSNKNYFEFLSDFNEILLKRLKHCDEQRLNSDYHFDINGIRYYEGARNTAYFLLMEFMEILKKSEK